MSYSEQIEYFELIDGEERRFSRSSIPHATVLQNLVYIFATYFREKLTRVFTKTTVYFDDLNHLIPDLLIVCDRKKIKYNGIHGAPDLIVEILSPSTAMNDRTKKKDVYERFGVREYWIVDPKNRAVEVYRLTDGKLKMDYIYHDFSEDDWSLLTEDEKARERLFLKVSLYDDLEIDVKEIFEDIEED